MAARFGDPAVDRATVTCRRSPSKFVVSLPLALERLGRIIVEVEPRQRGRRGGSNNRAHQKRTDDAHDSHPSCPAAQRYACRRAMAIGNAKCRFTMRRCGRHYARIARVTLPRRAGDAAAPRAARSGTRSGRAAGPGSRLRDQLSRRADHRGQISAEAAAAVRAGKRDRGRGRGDRRGRRRLDAGDRLIAATGFGGLAEKVVVPARRAIPLAAGAQLRRRLGAAADLCDGDPRAGRPRPARSRADLAGARRGGRRRHCRGRDRQGARRAGDRGGIVGGKGRGGARRRRRRGDRLSDRRVSTPKALAAAVQGRGRTRRRAT